MTHNAVPGKHACKLADLTLSSPLAVRNPDSCSELVLELYDHVSRYGIRPLTGHEPGQLPGHGLMRGILDAGNILPVRPKALLLDVYGTLLASTVGEPGLSAADPGRAVRPGDAADAPRRADAPPGVEFPDGLEIHLRELVAMEHARLRIKGIRWPEVDSIELFRRALDYSTDCAGRERAARACIAWECLYNPCTAMPGAEAFLSWCCGQGLPLGIVSNAQFYTPLFLEAAFRSPVLDTVFDQSLLQWSYLGSHAKPDLWMFQILARVLEQRDIRRSEVLVVGNDALNDCAAAKEAGFMACLFAGDARSLRLQESDQRVCARPPDIIVQSWRELQVLLGGKG